MSDVVVDALLAQGSRPSWGLADDGVLLNLRGVNMNSGADPADMVSIHIWGERRLVVSTQWRRLRAVNDVEKHLYDGTGPKDVGELLADLSKRLSERMSHVVFNINDQVDDLEEVLVAESAKYNRKDLQPLRREVIRLRRYIVPQREAMGELAGKRIPWVPALEQQ